MSSLEDKHSASLWSKGPACTVSSLKDLGSLVSGFLFCNAVRCMCRCHVAYFAFYWPVGNGTGELCKKMVIF